MSEQTEPKLIVTMRDPLDFLSSRGVQVPRACPKCSFSPWDEGFDEPEKVMATLSHRDRAQINASHTFYFRCPNCGFLEYYSWRPLMDWMLNGRK